MRTQWSELEALTNELASLDAAGFALPEGLESAARQARSGAFRATLEETTNACRDGAALSEAMARKPGTFPAMFVSLVRAGEQGGNMLDALRSMGTFLEVRRRINSALRVATIYPAFVLTLAVFISGYVTFWLMPRHYFAVIEALHLLVPGSSDQFPRIVGIALVVQKLMVAAFAGLWIAAAGVAVTGVIAPSSRGYHELLLKLPLYGRVFRHYLLYHFAGVVGLLTREGVRLPEALENLAGLRDSPLVSDAAHAAWTALQNGKPLSAGLADAPWFPRSEIWLMSNAEKQEKLEVYLEDLQKRSAEGAGRVENIFRQLEPVAIAALSGLVGIYVVSVFLPLVTHFKYLRIWE